MTVAAPLEDLRGRLVDGPLSAVGWAVLGVATVAWTLGWVTAGRPLFLLAYGALAVVAAAWATTRPARMLQVERDPLPARGTEEDAVSVSVSVSGAARDTVLVDRLPAALGGDLTLDVIPPAPGDTSGIRTCGYVLASPRRGVWPIGPVVAVRTDPAGLVTRTAVLGATDDLVVHPRVEPLADRPLARLLDDPPIRPPRPRPWRTGIEFSGSRAYSPGDDLRRVLWRAYARTGTLLVRESEQGVTDRVVFVLGADRGVHLPGDPSPTFEAAARVVASMGMRHLADGFTVELRGGGAPVGPLRGAGSGLALLDALARAERDDRPLAEVLLEVDRVAPGDAHLVVVTPALDPAALATLGRLLERGRSALVVGLAFDDDHIDGLAQAPLVGAHLLDVRPDERLATAFARQLGAVA